MYTHMYTHIYIYRERERDRGHRPLLPERLDPAALMSCAGYTASSTTYGSSIYYTPIVVPFPFRALSFVSSDVLKCVLAHPNTPVIDIRSLTLNTIIYIYIYEYT